MIFPRFSPHSSSCLISFSFFLVLLHVFMMMLAASGKKERRKSRKSLKKGNFIGILIFVEALLHSLPSFLPQLRSTISPTRMSRKISQREKNLNSCLKICAPHTTHYLFFCYSLFFLWAGVWVYCTVENSQP